MVLKHVHVKQFLVLIFYVHFVTVSTQLVYVGTNDGHLAISRNSGAGGSWSTVFSNGGHVYSINARGNNVYAGTQAGLHVSHDNGDSWTVKNLQNTYSCAPTVASIFVDEDKRVYALIGAQSGCGRVAVSEDNGDTWPINFPLPNPPFAFEYVNNIYVDGPRIYVATFGGAAPPSTVGGLGYTDDLGATWTFKDQTSGLGSNDAKCVIGRGPRIYVGLGMYGSPVSMSEDGGRIWKTANTTPTGFQDYVSSLYVQDDTLYVAIMGGGLAWTNDFTTWTRKTTVEGLASDTTSSIIVSGNTLYLGTNNGLSISLDNGQRWITKTTQDGLPSNVITSVFAPRGVRQTQRKLASPGGSRASWWARLCEYFTYSWLFRNNW